MKKWQPSAWASWNPEGLGPGDHAFEESIPPPSPPAAAAEPSALAFDDFVRSFPLEPDAEERREKLNRLTFGREDLEVVIDRDAHEGAGVIAEIVVEREP